MNESTGRNSRATPPAIGRRTTQLQKLLRAKLGATSHPMTAPRGSSPLVEIYKVMGRMFAILSMRDAEYVIVKCDPHHAQALRSQYAGIRHRSHLDKRYWISIDLDADVPVREVRQLVEQSYQLVCATLTAKQRAELAEASEHRPAPPVSVLENRKGGIRSERTG
jgi:predicted DNA-binding protein (MmcQ/YjbR family)